MQLLGARVGQGIDRWLRGQGGLLAGHRRWGWAGGIPGADGFETAGVPMCPQNLSV
jgi:hypothetical protein